MKNPIALRIFLVGTITLFLAIVPTFNNVFASNIIFQDDFEHGAGNWTPISGASLWQIKNINGNNMYGARIESPSTIIDTVGGPDINTPNYKIDFDYLPVVNTNTQTVDRNLDFRWVNNTNLYELHFQGNSNFVTVCNGQLINTQSATSMLDNQINRINIILLNQHIQFILNGTKIFDCVDATYQFTGTEKIGMRISTGGAYPTEAWFDNIVVTSLDETPTSTPTPTPTSIPTATPIPTVTPTPTPSPTQVNLNVPVLRQTDKLWSTETYDGANFWSPLAKTIKNWGCSLTSYAMVLNYFGINKLPDGNILNPGTLNTWLENNYGYIDGKNSGYVNPLAISSLSKKAAKINKITSFDALEYSRIATSNSLVLANQINNGIPVVLEEPGHYIVANGINGNTFTIIDPYYVNRNNLTAYGNTFISINELTPSQTNLSYIMVTGNESLNFQFEDPHGNNVGEQFYQQSLINPETGNSGGIPLKIAYLQKPKTGNYKLKITSNKQDLYVVKIYLYDSNGNVNVKNIHLVSDVNKIWAININFDSQKADESKVNKVITFEYLINDLNFFKFVHLINDQVYKVLILSIDKTEDQYHKKLMLMAKNELGIFKDTLRFYDGKGFDQKAYPVILEDIDDLINNL